MSNDNSPSLDVHHNAGDKRFEVMVDGYRGDLDYFVTDGVITFTHTGVPREIGNRGIGAALVKVGLDYAREKGLRVRPLCSFVDIYMRRHPDYDTLRA